MSQIAVEEERRRATETCLEISPSLDALIMKVKYNHELTSKDIAFLIETIKRISDNEIPHLERRLSRLERGNTAPVVATGITTATSALLSGLASMLGNTQLGLVFLIPTVIGAISTCWIILQGFK